ncbi:MAG TPA: magnesium/cobalt transporter CorA [Dehalococcoidia bacterium]|nr:magnesium/cobalt transporter CorA [Dehalococcoidia bacterium]
MYRSLCLTNDKELQHELSQDELNKILATPDALLWVDVSAEDETSEELLHKVFEFHPLAIEDCFNGRVETPKVDDYGTYLFIVAQSVKYIDPLERLQLNELGLFLGSNFVVSVHQRPIETVEALFDRVAQSGHLLTRGADFLAHAIIDTMVDQLLPAVEELDEQLATLEQSILELPRKEQLTEVLMLKRNTLRLRRSILPQRDMVNRLSRGEFGNLIRSDALIFYRDVYDHVVRVEELLDGLRDLADSALSSYLSVVNNRMNEVMKAMSVVAVIFLPLTLIASIFGTNFDYSVFGFTLPGGFIYMLISMGVITGFQIYLFKRRGWF